jgi:uncharacterized membrane protein YfcA
MDWAYTVSGFVVGFIVGMTGVGAGALMTPLLVLVFGISPAIAVGTDLLYASLTKCAGAWVHTRRGRVDWRVVSWLAAGSVPAALLTLAGIRALGVESRQFSLLVTTALGGVLVLTAIALAVTGRLRLGQLRERIAASRLQRYRVFVTLAVGAVLGALVTLTSVGAGALGIVALLAVYPRIPAATLVGSDIAHAVPLTLVAGLGHAALGSVDFRLLAALLAGSLPGIYLGSHVAGRLPERVLRDALAVVLAVTGGKLVW